MALFSTKAQWRIAAATEEVVLGLWPRGPSTEPKTVFDLFCTKRAAERWNRALGERRLRVTYSAVFTHKKPYVTFRVGGRAGKCEVADVLLVVLLPDRKRRHAILLQAKKS